MHDLMVKLKLHLIGACASAHPFGNESKYGDPQDPFLDLLLQRITSLGLLHIQS